MVIGIAGLGLIGGSMAKALKTAPDNKILGFDSDESILTIAEIYGALDGRLTEENISECDCLILSLYPDASCEYLKKMAPFIRKDAIVTDCCGTKRLICKEGFELAEKYGFTFVGGHPMAGTHKSGFKYSTEDMFRGASMVLVPPVYDNMQLLDKMKAIFAPCGFEKFSITTPEQHDRLIAFTSQMAHIVSNAFIKSPSAPDHTGVSAGSYKDLTRVAWLNPDMWTALFLENKDNLLSELDFLINSLNEYRQAIATDDSEKLRELLDEGRKRKQEVDG